MTKYWITGFSPFTNATEMPWCFLNTAKSSAAVPKEEQSTFKDCAEVFKSGLSTSGIYTLTFPNSTEEIKVRKDTLQQPWGLPWVTAKAKEPLSTHSSCPSQAHTEGSAVAGHRAGCWAWPAALPPSVSTSCWNDETIGYPLRAPTPGAGITSFILMGVSSPNWSWISQSVL